MERAKFEYEHPEASPFDQFGLPKKVPHYAARTFRDAQRLLKIVHDMAILQFEIKKLEESPAAVLLDKEKIDYCFSVIRREVVSKTPFRICRRCQPDDEECPHCHKRYWIPVEVSEPEEIARRMAAYPLVYRLS